jgi:hypothetical protein
MHWITLTILRFWNNHWNTHKYSNHSNNSIWEQLQSYANTDNRKGNTNPNFRLDVK